MPWTPTYNLFDKRNIGTNLVNYFKANQADALLWANDENKELDVATKVADSQIVKPIPDEHFFLAASNNNDLWPAFTIVQSEFIEAKLDGVTVTQLVVLYQIEIVDGRSKFLVAVQDIFRLAFQSMIQEIPNDVLNNGHRRNQIFQLSTIETEEDVLRTDGNDFYQAFQQRITWEVEFEPML